MILVPRKIKSVTVSTVFPSICHEVMGPDAWFYIKMPVWKGSQILCKVQRYPAKLRRAISALQYIL